MWLAIATANARGVNVDGVVHIRYVWMLVSQLLMAVPMRVRLTGWIICCVGVLVVLVMHMWVAMLNWLVLVLVVMMQQIGRSQY